MADNYVRLGEPENAVDAFMSVLAIHEDPHTYVRAALSLDQSGRPDEAIAMCRNAVRLAPLKSDGYSVLARTLYVNGRLEEALEVVLSARPQFPIDSTVWHMLSMTLANVQRDLGRIEAAKQTYREVLDNDAVPSRAKRHVRELISSLEPDGTNP